MTMSDKAVAVFAFAAYHQMTSGETVTDVVLSDGAGHKADQGAIEELSTAGLVTVDAGRAAFTSEGQAKLAEAVAALRKLA